MQINRDRFNYFSSAEIEEAGWNELVEAGTLKHVKAGAMLCEQGSTIRELLCIKEGTVKLVHFFNNGNEKIYEQLLAPAFIGIEALWSAGAELFFPGAIAVTDVSLSSVPVKLAEKMIEQQPEMIVSMFQCVRNVMCVNRIQNVCAAPMSLLQKAAFAIVLMSRAGADEEGYVTVTHEELAQFIGISRANVTTALAELVARGMISKSRGKVKIIDSGRIMKFLDNPFQILL